MENRVLVFGSNLEGIHGAGAALLARTKYGAMLGIGRGRTGRAYAIPTKKTPSREGRQLDLNVIKLYVDEFKTYATANPNTIFVVTRIGCGLAGYLDAEIAPMFAGSPSNCEFSPRWAFAGLKPWKISP